MRYIQTAAGTALLLLAACTGESQRAPTISPEAASRMRIAEIAENSGRPDLALNMIAAAARAAPDDPVTQARHAQALVRAGRAPEAERILMQSVARWPNRAEVLLALGRLRVREPGGAGQALVILDRAIAVAPNDASAHDTRGVALDLLGRHGEAQQAYGRALQIQPSHVAASSNFAFSLLITGQTARARALLEPLVRRPDAPPRVVNNYALILAAEGRADEAARISPEPLSAEEWTAAAQALTRTGR